jgi:hypothetical protein
MLSLRHIASVVVLLSLSACAERRAASSGDPISDMEISCVYAQSFRGDTEGAQGCMNLADRMRARRAAAYHPPAQITSQPSGPITWVAQTEPNSLRITTEQHATLNMVSVTLTGPIGTGDAARFRSAFHDVAEAYPRANGLVMLNSPGGSVAEARSIAAMINASGLTVAVDKGAECASACFLVFAAAKRKFASYSARIGVHSASDRLTGTETVGSMAGTTGIARTYAALGVPADIIGRMVATPAGQVAWLSDADLRSMGVQMIPLSAEN